MNISVELTLMPLQNEFEEPIKSFIKQLRKANFVVLENPLSTQVYGEYDAVMQMLTKEIKNSFQTMEHCLINMKIVKSDRSDYEPNF